jgi:hypothetical protein
MVVELAALVMSVADAVHGLFTLARLALVGGL